MTIALQDLLRWSPPCCKPLYDMQRPKMFELPLDNPPALKTCAECAHLIGVRNHPEYAAGWLCDHPSNIKSTSIDPVTGLETKARVYYNCGEARKDEWKTLPPNKRVLMSCGQAGQWFKLYEKPTPRVIPPRAGASPGAEALLNELENLR